MTTASLEEFDKHAEIVIRSVRSDNRNVWFRGHSKGAYKLLPSLLRQNNSRGLKFEAELFAEFVRRAANKSVNNAAFPHDNDWAILSLMRHYGVPTRLLDWTTDFNVALYFALCQKTQDPCIWVLNPFRLNSLTVGYNVIFDDVDKLMLDGAPFKYYECVRVRPRKPWPFPNPVAMAPPFMNHRIEAQGGAFTVHGSDPQPIEAITRSYMSRISIPSRLRKPLWRRLMKSGVNGGGLFPDLFGVALGLREQFNLTS